MYPFALQVCLLPSCKTRLLHKIISSTGCAGHIVGKVVQDGAGWDVHIHMLCPIISCTTSLCMIYHIRALEAILPPPALAPRSQYMYPYAVGCLPPCKTTRCHDVAPYYIICRLGRGQTSTTSCTTTLLKMSSIYTRYSLPPPAPCRSILRIIINYGL